MSNQTIKHRRGPVGSVVSIADYRQAELIIATGSVDSKFSNPVVMIADPDGTGASSGYRPVSRLYTGAGLPNVTPAGFGESLNGLPYYDSTNKKLYILGSNANGLDGHTEIQLTGSSINNFATDVSASAAANGFGAGGGSSVFELVSGTIYRSNGKDLQITGSGGSEKYALRVSQSIHAYNINVGYPTSNDWGTNLEGSYFNQFTPDTDVSEILRFVAGLLSSSAPDASANTRTYGDISENITNTTTTAAPAGVLPNGTNIEDLIYLTDQGYVTPGETIFSSLEGSLSNITTNTNINIKYSSTKAGSTNVSSSNDTQLFGLGPLNSGNAQDFKVKGTHAFEFYSSSAAFLASATTATSASSLTITNSGFGTTAGVTTAKINTANPAVIPAGFQDGKFVNVHEQKLVNKDGAATWHGKSLTSISSSGYYKINTTVGIATGSQSTFTDKTKSELRFYAPISTLNSNIGSNTLTGTNFAQEAQTLTTTKLSGKPYVNGGTWAVEGTASGVFDPMYADSTTTVRTVITDPAAYNIAKSTGENSLSTNGGQIQTSGVVYSTAGVGKNSGVPDRTDLVHVSASYTISGTGTTITKARQTTPSTFKIATSGSNRSSAQSGINEQTLNLHTGGDFGVTDVMQYFGGGVASGVTSEKFTNETYRRIISGNTSTQLTNAWDSDTTTVNLGNGGDLQVKPGFLVDPESSHGYHYPTTGYNATDVKWYLREFETSATSNKGTLVINLDPNSSADLVDYESTTGDKIAIGVIFEATNSVIFDAVKGNQSYNGNLNSESQGALNPFSDSVDIVGDFSSITNSNGTLTLGLNNSVGQTINGTNSKIWLLIRYKGTPNNPLTAITVSVS